jgi:hypothetical protein
LEALDAHFDRASDNCGHSFIFSKPHKGVVHSVRLAFFTMTMGRNRSTKKPVPTKSKLKKDPGVPRLVSLKVKNIEKSRAVESFSNRTLHIWPRG